MSIDRDWKQLYVDLRRIKLGDYLETEEFELLITEFDFDEEWYEINHNLGYSDELVQILIYILMGLSSESDNIHLRNSLMKTILVEFMQWNVDKTEYKFVIQELKYLGFFDPYEEIYSFEKELEKLNSLKNNEEEQASQAIAYNKSIFVVHGHDNEARLQTTRFIEKLGYNAIILHEQASGGKTIIEKIEEYSDVGFGIVLYTPCDYGRKSTSKSDEQPRARQNVVFEHGYLIGKIGRSRVCALVKGQIEKPNDISGVVYIEMDKNNAWQMMVCKEMKRAGYKVDMNAL